MLFLLFNIECRFYNYFIDLIYIDKLIDILEYGKNWDVRVWVKMRVIEMVRNDGVRKIF